MFFCTFAANGKPATGKMEGEWPSIHFNHHHFRTGRQPYRLCCQMVDAILKNRINSFMDSCLYINCYHSMAILCSPDQHSIWPIPVLHEIHKEDRSQNWDRASICNRQSAITNHIHPNKRRHFRLRHRDEC